MFISAQLEILYIGIYLVVALIDVIMGFGRARSGGMNRTQSAIRTAVAAICGLVTFLTTGTLANFTAHVLGTPIEFSGFAIGVSPNPFIQLLGYAASILAVIVVLRLVGHWLIPVVPDDGPDTGAGIPPAD